MVTRWAKNVCRGVHSVNNFLGLARAILPTDIQPKVGDHCWNQSSESPLPEEWLLSMVFGICILAGAAYAIDIILNPKAGGLSEDTD